MRLTFKASGGFAPIPALTAKHVIDTDELPREQGQELEELVRAADLFSLPQRISNVRPGAADHRTYTISADDGQRAHTVQVDDLVEDDNLRRLIDRLRTLTRPV
jgi:hypothetical protein